MIYTLYPYKLNGFWVFDDPSTGLEKEGLVLGIDLMLDRLTKNIDGEVVLTVSDSWLQDALVLDFQGEGEVDNEDWSLYWSKELQQEGWLCPNLKLYFKPPPPQLFFILSKKIS